MKNRLVLLLLIGILAGTVWYARKHVQIKPFTQAEVIATDPVVTPPAKDRESREASRASSQEDAFCKVINSHADIPMGGKLKVWIFNYEADEDGTSGMTALIQSSECPNGLFSKVRIDNLGRVKEALDCRTATKESLLTSTAMQGVIEERKSEGQRLHLAIAGSGYFVIECSDGVYLTRSGNFYWDGLQATSGYCRVLAKDGQYFSWNEEDLDENGCTTQGSCIAVVDPDPNSIRYFNRTMFITDRDPLNRPALDARVINNAVEKLDDPYAGPTGPNWDKVPDFIPPQCPP